MGGVGEDLLGDAELHDPTHVKKRREVRHPGGLLQVKPA
jgi:hypothetical protein